MTSTTKNHQKHGKTVKAKFGEFGRTELSVLGTPCSNIKQLSRQIIEKLSGYNIAYVDADHKTEEEEKSAFLQSGAGLVYTDKIAFQRFDGNVDVNKFQRNIIFNEYDLVLINGNHFNSRKQIVVIDEKKPLDKKLDKITDVLMILFREGNETIPDYLKDHIPGIEAIPRLKFDDHSKIAELIQMYLAENEGPLFGLVLAGGQSIRMNRDKGLINYRGLPHREYLLKQLRNFTTETFMSFRPGQTDGLKEDYKLITDSFSDLGPFGAILSAFREHPDKAWLVLACDLPFVNADTIGRLVSGRNKSKIATAFYNEKTEFPEPLITIWEPKAYPVLLNFMALGYSCPRKVLINSEIEMLYPENQTELINANNPEEYEAALKVLRKK